MPSTSFGLPDSFITPDSAMSSAGIHVARSWTIIWRLTVTDVVYLRILDYNYRRRWALRPRCRLMFDLRTQRSETGMQQPLHPPLSTARTSFDSACCIP